MISYPKCETCTHSRVVTSENGSHCVCCLPQKVALDCVTGKKDYCERKEVGVNEEEQNKAWV